MFGLKERQRCPYCKRTVAVSTDLSLDRDSDPDLCWRALFGTDLSCL